ncbi:MAG TPA: proline iminopeptidase-family hydrolase [Gaiellaceae bacterium]|nr:proline iminopeptidase-family hydrolase [Gaiellaceae bacterium]
MRAGEGFLPFREYKTWYRVVGEGEEPGKLPVLCLHGGPGGTHDYLEPLEELARTGRRAIFYDQIGCGKSDLPDDTSLWVVETFVEEVGAVREHLGLDRLHIFGSSWGGMLAMEYALTQPEGVRSMIVASSPSSMIQWVDEATRLRRDLPADVQATLTRHEEAGTTGDPEYEEAVAVFYRRHLCRVDPMPDCVLRSFQFIAEHGVVYNTMNGPSEFHVTGLLKNWDITDRLGEIRIPTLVITGEFDEATPAINRTVSGGIPGAESVIYPGVSHMAHVEDTEGYLEALDGFLTRMEAGPRSQAA